MPWLSQEKVSEEAAILAESSPEASRLLCRLLLLEKALDAISECVVISTAVDHNVSQVLYRNTAACVTLSSQSDDAAAATASAQAASGSATEELTALAERGVTLERCPELLVSEIIVEASPMLLPLLLTQADSGSLTAAASRTAAADRCESASCSSAARDNASLSAATTGNESHRAGATENPSSCSGSGPEHVRIQIGSSVSPLRNPGLQAVLEAAPIGTYTCLPNRDAEWVSSQAKLEAGPADRQVTGKGWRLNVHPDDLHISLAAGEVAAATGQLPSVVIRLKGSIKSRSSGVASTVASTAAGSAPTTGSAPPPSTAASAALPASTAASSAPSARTAGTSSSSLTTSSAGAATTSGPERNGEWRYYECAMNALRHPTTGALVRWVGTMHDVHERKLLEQKLEAERTLFSTAMDQLPVSVVVADAPNGAVRFSNQAAKSVWPRRLTQEERVATVLGDYSSVSCSAFHPDGRPYCAGDWPLMRSIVHGEVVANEETVVHRL